MTKCRISQLWDVKGMQPNPGEEWETVGWECYEEFLRKVSRENATWSWGRRSKVIDDSHELDVVGSSSVLYARWCTQTFLRNLVTRMLRKFHKQIGRLEIVNVPKNLPTNQAVLQKACGPRIRQQGWLLEVYAKYFDSLALNIRHW